MIKMQITANRAKTPSFKAGLTTKIINEVKSSNVAEIEIALLKKGIKTDFANDKISAFCVNKLVEIFQMINKKFKTNFELPKAVFVEDFQRLDIQNKKLFAFTNLLPAKLKNGSNEVFSEQSIFLNNQNFKFNDIETNLKNLNLLADKNFEAGFYSGNLFFHNYLHEFSHCAHEGSLLNKLKNDSFAQKLTQLLDKKTLHTIRIQYDDFSSKSSSYSSENAMELIAEELSRLIQESLNPSNLMPHNDRFKNSFLSQNKLLIKVKNMLLDCTDAKNKILNNFWIGKIE